MARRDDLKKLIHNHSRRLQILREQQALAGWSVDPKILIEIEDIATEIKDLQTELAVIESRVKPTRQDDAAKPGGNYEKTLPVQTPYILVVDDEPDFLNNLGLTLEIAGYQIITAKDGVEALTLLQFKRVDLILSDISMPFMGGYQLYDLVCKHPQWVTIPFVFLSARDMDSDICYGKEMGADDYLTKPVSTEHLLSVVRGKLRRRTISDSLKIVS